MDSFLQQITFQLSQGARCVGVSLAQDHLLGDVVRALWSLREDLEVYPSIESLQRAPLHSIAVLLSPDNLAEVAPVFEEKRLSLLLWDRQGTWAQREETSWVSSWIKCPQVTPRHGVENIKAAFESELRYFVWRGDFLQQCIQEAFPMHRVYWANAAATFDRMKAQTQEASDAEWIVWSGVENSWQHQLITIANGKQKHIAQNPRGIFTERHPLIHAELSLLDKVIPELVNERCSNPGRLAALTNLEPEVVILCKALLFQGRTSAEIESLLLTALHEGEALYRLPPGAGMNLQDKALRYRSISKQLVKQNCTPLLSFEYVLYHNAHYFAQQNPELTPLAQALIKEAKEANLVQGLAYLDDLAQMSLFMELTPENLCRVADFLLNESKYKKSIELYQEALQRTEPSDIALLGSLLIRLTRAYSLVNMEVAYECLGSALVLTGRVREEQDGE